MVAREWRRGASAVRRVPRRVNRGVLADFPLQCPRAGEGVVRQSEVPVGFQQRLSEIRTGFEPAFWVANVSELFERLAYYAAFASLANYLHEALGFSTEQTSNLAGFFGGLVWFLAIVGGALADRLGFRRALSTAYLILTASYFLLGSIGSSWLAPVRNAVPLWWLVLIILALPALGVALVKPSVVGTTARASSENVRSIGYSIYYTLVNIGGAAGPYMAAVVHTHLGVANVFRVSALFVFAMLIAVLLFFREPERSGEARTATLGQAGRNFLTVLSNPRFMLFLIIFSGFYVVFWQEFITLPLYIHAYIDPNANVEMILITDAAAVMCLQIMISYLLRSLAPFKAITLGMLISGLGWMIVSLHAAVWTAVLSIFVVAVGEMVQQPRYYEYISRLAPPGQQGTYMGFAFLPIGIGSLVGGWLGGRLMHHFGEVTHHPERMWWAITLVGLATTLLLWLYDIFLKPDAAKTAVPPA
jgi:dipeptide/tripeptide permease